MLTCGSLTGKRHLRRSCDEWAAKQSVRTIPIDAVGAGVVYDPPPTPTVDWDYFDIFIAHVVSPGMFTFQLIGLDSTVALDKLMDQIEKCYSSPQAQAYQ